MRQAGVVEAELARQAGFGHAGHADQVAAVAAHARDFGARFQARALGGAVAAAVDQRDAGALRRSEDRRAQRAACTGSPKSTCSTSVPGSSQSVEMRPQV